MQRAGNHSVKLRGWRFGVLLALAWMVLGFLLVPAFVVFPVSLTDTAYLALPKDGLSLAHWADFLTSARWAGGLRDSLVIAGLSTVVAVAAGTLCAIACWRAASWLTESIRLLALLPLIVPTIVYALALYRFYADLGLLDTYLGVILAHAAIGLPFVVITVGAALTNFDPRLEQAARNLGATMPQAMRLVVIPNITPGILAGAIFAFVNSWDELVIVLFIASRRVTTLPRLIWDGVNESLSPTIAAVAAGLILVTIVLLIPLRKLRAVGASGD
jgi:putative spermidine/putrescine transport system permease protein